MVRNGRGTTAAVVAAAGGLGLSLAALSLGAVPCSPRWATAPPTSASAVRPCRHRVGTPRRTGTGAWGTRWPTSWRASPTAVEPMLRCGVAAAGPARCERHRRRAGAGAQAPTGALPAAPSAVRGAARDALGAERRSHGRERRRAPRGPRHVHGDSTGDTRGRPAHAVPNRRVSVALGSRPPRRVRLGR